MLRISGLVEESVVDGPGYRFTVFTQGCPHFCPGCHNPQTHSPDGGRLISITELFERMQDNPMLQGVTFSGGEPFLQADILVRLAKRIHQETKLDIIAYTGFTFEHLVNNGTTENSWPELLEELDYLIDGPFILARKSLSLPFRGSENQRIISVKESLKEGKAVMIDHF